MTWTILILFVLGLVFIPKMLPKKIGKPIDDLLDTPLMNPNSLKISEEAIFKTQNKFENKLQNETEFPDAIGGNEVYIYWKLMRVWFDKLSAANRYNDEMTQKLRNDWLDYMEAVGDRSTYNYLSLEFYDKDKEKEDSYREQHITASQKMFAIEAAFASAIGKDAVNELAKIRALEYGDFSRSGELAPDGFKWDLGQRNLVPKNSPPPARSLFPKVKDSGSK